MRQRPAIFLLAICLAIVASGEHEVIACSCPPQGNDPDSIEAGKSRADLVFSGYVISKSVKTKWSSLADHQTRMSDAEVEPPWVPEFASPRSFASRYGANFVRPLVVEVKFKVFHVWKGEVEDEVEVRTQISGGSCGYGFRVGEDYLVYAQSSGPTPSVHQCSRTARLKNGMEDVRTLGEPVVDHVHTKARQVSGKTRQSAE